jgi:SAM-dependent methyltransferase
MNDGDGCFGEGVAARYDDSCADMFEPGLIDTVVEVLAGLAGGGRALELGIGTGRIALPLARRGVTVHGVDLSRAMVARLRAKPGGDAIEVTIGDFATARANGTFTVAYLVFNTINSAAWYMDACGSNTRGNNLWIANRYCARLAFSSISGRETQPRPTQRSRHLAHANHSCPKMARLFLPAGA